MHNPVFSVESSPKITIADPALLMYCLRIQIQNDCRSLPGIEMKENKATSN